MKEGVGAHGMERAGLSMSTWRLAVGEGLRRYDEATWPVARSNNEAMAPPCPVPTVFAPFEARGDR